jgi:hypothetical protein
MKTACSCARPRAAYLLIEALVYIGCVFVILGFGYAAVYRYIDHSVVLRRDADDIARALEAGERWRADVRSAAGQLRLENTETNQVLRFSGSRGELAYRFSAGTVSRQLASGPWIPLLQNVRSSAMQPDPRQNVTAWVWELELQPRTKASIKAGRVRPLFTFFAVPQTRSSP